MKTTLSWLKEHLETDAPIEVIADRLIMLVPRGSTSSRWLS